MCFPYRLEQQEYTTFKFKYAKHVNVSININIKRLSQYLVI